MLNRFGVFSYYAFDIKKSGLKIDDKYLKLGFCCFSERF